MYLRLSLIHVSTLAELFINISAGYFGLVLFVAVPRVSLIAVLKNLILGAAFYYLAVKLRTFVYEFH